MQKFLFNKKAETKVWGGREFRRVTIDDYQIFRDFAKLRTKVSYYGSASHFMHYWNTANYELFINVDYAQSCELIPVSKKFSKATQFHIVDPIFKDFATILDICKSLQLEAVKGVYIRYIYEQELTPYQNELFEKFGSVEKEFIYDLYEQSSLPGKKFASYRKKINQFERTNNLNIRFLNSGDIEANEKFLNEWVAGVGPDYFRPSVGKDKRLIQMFADGDEYDFTIGAFDGDRLVGAVSSSIDPDTGVMCGIYSKCLRGYGNLSQYLERMSSQEGLKRGAVVENYSSASGSSAGIRTHKMMRKPCDFWNFYSFKYVGEKDAESLV